MTNEFRNPEARWHSSIVILVWSLALLLVSCDKPATPQPQRPVRVYLTCDVNGRIEPCGCFTGQYGGLSRTQTVLMADAKPSLRVDAGDSIGGAEDYHVLQFKHVLQAFQSLGFHAVNLGRREAALNAETLKKLVADSPVPLVSANVVDARTQAPVARPWVQTTVEGVRYGIVGIVDPKSVGETDLGAGLELVDPASAITKWLPEAKKDAEVLVLLAFAREERMKELAAQFFEFQLILGGDVGQPSQELVRANRSFIMATTNQSRALGLFEATWKPGGMLEKPKQQIIFMADDIPQDEEIIAHAVAYRDEVRRTKLAIDDPKRARDDAVPGVRLAAKFVGSEACSACHAEDYAIWQKSAHSMAFPALQRRDSDADPSCIGCHTIGFGTESGYRREFAGKRLTQVGCESCHGPGSTHVEQRNAQRTQAVEPTFHFRPLAAADCTTCHHGEFSRPFEWEEFWRLIAHGKKK